MPIGNFRYIIDLYIIHNFISWLLKTIYTCEMINKSSKSNSCYIDSDYIKERIVLHF